MAKKKRTKASLLKFLKGPAILDLYNFMREAWSPQLYTGAERTIKKQLKKDKKGESKRPIGVQECITYGAVESIDPLCEQTIDFMWEIVASLTQKLALTLAPVPGA